MRGGFRDEYGRVHTASHALLNLTRWEVFNEVDYEHAHSAESYTLVCALRGVAYVCCGPCAAPAARLRHTQFVSHSHVERSCMPLCIS